MFEIFGFGSLYGIFVLLFGIALLTALVCLIVFLVSASRAVTAIARYRRVQTELLLAESEPNGAEE